VLVDMTERTGMGAAVLAAVLALGACAGKGASRTDDPTGGSGAVASGGNAGLAGAAPGGAGAGGLSAVGGDAGSGAGSGATGSGGAGAGGAGSGGIAGAGAGGVAGGGAGSDGAGTGGEAPVVCVEAPVPSRTTGTLIEVSTELTLRGEPLAFGEPNPLESGSSLTPLEVRFYVSEVLLVRTDATTVAVDIVGDGGLPVPYGIQLVNAEDAASLRFRLLAPPGSYSGLSFTLGVNDACNSGFPRSGPLSAASAMTWPHGFGYLFLRYAGSVMPAGAESDPPSVIHVGGFQGTLFAPRVQAPGELTVEDGATASTRLVFDLNELFRASDCSLDPTTFPGQPDPAVLLGECVRQQAPERPLFTLSPP
jgi:hypothetical protein